MDILGLMLSGAIMFTLGVLVGTRLTLRTVNFVQGVFEASRAERTRFPEDDENEGGR